LIHYLARLIHEQSESGLQVCRGTFNAFQALIRRPATNVYTAAMIIISIAEQMLYHRRHTGVYFSYAISTAAKGAGNLQGSWQTPLGKHRIAEKIGSNLPPLTAFSGRKPVCIYDPNIDDPNHDWILSRILWLQGTETGINHRGSVDTHARYIYIHGTHDEAHIGIPASHGCIRMRNCDIIELFDHVSVGESVYIRST